MEMSSHQRNNAALARELIRLSLGDIGLRDHGDFPVFLVLQRTFEGLQDLPHGRREVLALAENALWRAASEWLSGRSFPTGPARNTIAAAKREGFDLVQRAQELLLPRQFLR
jgi:hypothetical protein